MSINPSLYCRLHDGKGLENPDCEEVCNTIFKGALLGSGQCGRVFNGGQGVVVKTLKEGSQDEDKVKFLEGSHQFMAQFML